jgi:citrate lyase subunit beta/citryl-CoA lyase
MDILRTLLFVPGNRQRMLERAPRTDADAIVVDLEDAVPASEKRAARVLFRAMLPKLAGSGKPVFVRVNNVRGKLTRDDVMGVVRPGLAGVIHPKTESPQDLRDLDVLLREANETQRPGDIVTIPLIESPLAVLRCEQIATASDRVVALSLGGEDYTAALGARRDAAGAALTYPRQVIATVASAYGMLAIDTPYADIKDERGLIAEAKLAQAIGLTGKYVIHPDQAAAVNAVFTPSKDEVAHARRVAAAAAQAAKQRRGSVSLDGRMIDAPVVARAEQVIALARGSSTRPEARPGNKKARTNPGFLQQCAMCADRG